MADESIPIRFSDESQQSSRVQSIAAEIAKVLTPNEEILYVAAQNPMSLSVRRDSVVATSNRLILFRAQILGQAQFDDFQWQDVSNATIK